jgi:putative DNA methylase
MIEKNFDIPFIADLALREKQIQQNYRPIIAVHKWFARRPGTLFRGLLLSEFSDSPLRGSGDSGRNMREERKCHEKG